MADVSPSDFPDYECALYRQQCPTWDYLDDLFEGRDGWTIRNEKGELRPTQKTQAYLPMFSEEDESDYHARLSYTPFSKRFAQSIVDFVGLIFRNGIQFDSVDPMIVEHFKDIDGDGLPAASFLSDFALAVMKLGHSFLYVDCPSGGIGEMSLADAAAARPRWQHIQARQVINWSSSIVNGRRRLTRAVIREVNTVPDGAYGEREETQYLVLTPGRFDRFTITGNGDEKQANYLADRSGVHGRYVGGQFVPLSRLPLVCVYGGLRGRDRSKLFNSTPPLGSLADLNLTHYRLHSDHLTKIHLCCFPVYVRVGSFAEQGGDGLSIGPGALVDVPQGGAFLIAEPNAGSIVQSRTELESLESVMDFLGTQYLIKPSDRQAAIVSLVQTAKIESSLQLFEQDFSAGINEALSIHHEYLGKQPATTFALDTRFMQQTPTDSQLLIAIVAFFEKLIMAPPVLRPILLQIAKQKGYLEQDLDIDSLLKSLPGEVKE